MYCCVEVLFIWFIWSFVYVGFGCFWLWFTYLGCGLIACFWRCCLWIRLFACGLLWVGGLCILLFVFGVLWCFVAISGFVRGCFTVLIVLIWLFLW